MARSRTLFVIVLTATLASCATACAADDATTVGTRQESTAATKGIRTEPASRALLAAIAGGEESGVGMRAVRGVYARGDGASEVYFVAIEFEVAGVGKQIGVWATTETEGRGTIYAVDCTAQRYTVWPHGNSTETSIAMSDDGAQAARDALHDRDSGWSPSPPPDG